MSATSQEETNARFNLLIDYFHKESNTVGTDIVFVLKKGILKDISDEDKRIVMAWVRDSGYFNERTGYGDSERYVLSEKAHGILRAYGSYSKYLESFANDKVIHDLQVENLRLSTEEFNHKKTIRDQEQRIRTLTEINGYWELAKKFWGLTLPILLASIYGLTDLVYRIVKGISILPF